MDSGEFALLFLYTRNLTDYSSVIEGPMVAITIAYHYGSTQGLLMLITSLP